MCEKGKKEGEINPWVNWSIGEVVIKNYLGDIKSIIYD